MTLDHIKQIETELNISLPKELAEKYTSNLLDGIENFPKISKLFVLDPNALININRKFRKKGLWKKPFPEHLLVIGGVGIHEYYLVNLHESPLQVYCVRNSRVRAYNPDNLEKNLITSVPGYNEIDAYYKSTSSRYLKLKEERNNCEKVETTKHMTIEEMVDKTIELPDDSIAKEIDWSQILKGSLIEKFLETEIDLDPMFIAYHDKEATKWHYDVNPENSLAFASTGVDGCHFCVVLKESVSIDESPIYYVSPMDFSEDTIVWAAKDFIDFLSIGAVVGDFAFISIIHSQIREEFIQYSEELWTEYDPNQKRECIKLLHEHFSLRKYDDIYSHVIQSYEDENNHADLKFTAIEVYTTQKGHFNL